MLLNISTGVAKTDNEAVIKYIPQLKKHIPQLSIWVIFNKLDTESDKSDEEICNLISDSLIKLKLIDEDDNKNFSSIDDFAVKNTFALSAKDALKAKLGYEIKKGKRKDLSQDRRQELLEDSRMVFFEKHFFQELTNLKAKLFNQKIDDCITIISNDIKGYENIIKSNKQQLDSTLSLKTITIRDKKQYIGNIKDCQHKFLEQIKLCKDEEAKLLKSKEYKDFKELTTKISFDIKDAILSSILTYQIIGGDSAKVLVEKGINNATPKIQEHINNYVSKILKTPVQIVTSIGIALKLFNERSTNKQLQPLSISLQGKLKYLDKAINEIEKALKNTTSLNFVDNKSFDAVLDTILETIGGVLITAIVSLFIMVIIEELLALVVSRLLIFLIPVIGWAIGIVVGIWALFGGETVAKKLHDKVKPTLEEQLPGEVKTILEQELYDKLIKDIIKDIYTIVQQLKKYIKELDVEISLTNGDIEEAESLLLATKQELGAENNECKAIIEQLSKYKSNLTNISEM